jgi:hypothetical protein
MGCVRSSDRTIIDALNANGGIYTSANVAHDNVTLSMLRWQFTFVHFPIFLSFGSQKTVEIGYR